MLNQQKIMVVMPAYHAEKTVRQTYQDIPEGVVDYFLLVDDASSDNTTAVAKELGIQTLTHPSNKGYGANQKTCYTAALESDADIVIMLHPDYQYDPKLIPAMAAMISSGVYDLVLGSRILGGGALKGGMPIWKYVANRFLTAFENLLLGAKLSEYHTGYRAYSRNFLESINWQDNSDDFIFDNQLIAQALLNKFNIGEITVPTRYFEDASSINFKRSVKYGFGVLAVSLNGLLQRIGLIRSTQD